MIALACYTELFMLIVDDSVDNIILSIFWLLIFYVANFFRAQSLYIRETHTVYAFLKRIYTSIAAKGLKRTTGFSGTLLNSFRGRTLETRKFL